MHCSNNNGPLFVNGPPTTTSTTNLARTCAAAAAAATGAGLTCSYPCACACACAATAAAAAAASRGGVCLAAYPSPHGPCCAGLDPRDTLLYGRRPDDYYPTPPSYWCDVHGVPWAPFLPDGCGRSAGGGGGVGCGGGGNGAGGAVRRRVINL